MYVKNTDPTLGKPMLIDVAKSDYDSLNDKDKYDYFRLYREFLDNFDNDWLIGLLCEYNDKSEIKIEDFMWYLRLRAAIEQGYLYLVIKPIRSFAFRDKQWEKNKDNVTEFYPYITIEKTKGNSDGLFFINQSLELDKVYANDKSEIMAEEGIILPSGMSGVVEFGYQPICKSSSLLLMNMPLLRVPYSHIYETPIMAIFFCTYNWNPFK